MAQDTTSPCVGMMQRTHSRLSRTSVSACLALLSAVCQMALADDWPGWRGLGRQGIAESGAGPTHWSTTENVAWKTKLPGEGHSSPIVHGDAVFVTTALDTQQFGPLTTVVRVALLLALAAVTMLAIALIVGRCRVLDLGRRELLGLVRLGFAVGVLAATVVFAEKYLDFGRGAERAWVVATVFGIVCLGLCVRAAADPRRGRLMAGIAQLALAAVVALCTPDKRGAFGEGLLNAIAAFHLAVIALPLLAGIASVARALSERRAANQGGQLGFGSIALVRLTSIGGPLLVAGVLAGLMLSETQDAATNLTVKPVAVASTTWALLGWLIVVTLLLGVWRWRLGASFGIHVALAVSGALLALAGAGALTLHVVSLSPYLLYQVGAPEVKPLFGWASVSLLTGAWFMWLLHCLAEASPRPRPSRGLAKTFAGATAFLGGLYFVYALYVPKAPTTPRSIVCLARDSGKIRWISEGLPGPPGRKHTENSSATPTPVTDGERVYAYFGAPGLVCTDFGGETLWTSKELPYDARHGVASSPILCDGKLIVLSDSDLGTYLGAFDCPTGKLLWKTDRAKAIHHHAGNCRTPTVEVIDGKQTLVVWGFLDLSGYDPDTGQELWSHQLGDFGHNPVATAVSSGNQMNLVGPKKCAALSKDGLSAGSPTVVWQKDLHGAQCSSPVVLGNLLFMVSDNGFAFCLDALTGETLWRQRIGRQFYASLVALGDRVYATSTAGTTTVFAAQRKYRQLGENDLGELTHASPAIVDGALFIRTKEHLWCIEES